MRKYLDKFAEFIIENKTNLLMKSVLYNFAKYD